MEPMFSLPSMNFTRKRSRSRRSISIAVTRDAQIIVRAPARISDLVLEKMVQEKADWIQKKIAYVQALPPLRTFDDSLGDYRTKRQSVLTFLEQRVAEINIEYQFLYTRIAVRRMKSRWGTCSRKGTLTFNFVITQLPHHLQTYIIVHELCHTKHFNHSSSFWEEVSRVVPHFKQCRKELRQYDLR